VGFGINDVLEIMFCTCSMLIYYTEIYIYHKKTHVMLHTSNEKSSSKYTYVLFCHQNTENNKNIRTGHNALHMRQISNIFVMK
jgi:hypothetical protein